MALPGELNSLAVPAAAAVASLSYLNARSSFFYDWHIITCIARGRIYSARRIKKDRVNNFYVLEEHAHNAATKDKPFLVYGSKTWTFTQAYDIVLRYAGWLHETHHVVAEEVIAIDFMNSPSFLFLSLALWSLGAMPALINYNLTGQPLIHSIRASSARMVIIDPEIQHQFSEEVLLTLSSPNFRQNSFPLDVITLTTQLESSLPYFPPYRAPDAVRTVPIARKPAVLIYTSGTTGLPKPAIIPWDRLCFGARFAGLWLGLNSARNKNPDRFYTSMPLYHSSAFVLGFTVCLNSGTTLVLSHKFSTKNFWPEVRQSRATAIQYVGETLRYLMANPHDAALDKSHSVRLAFGNGLRPDIWERFKSRFGVTTIAEFYSATESSSGSFNMSSNTFSSGAIGRLGSIGTFLLRNAAAIVKVNWDSEEPARDPRTGFCEKLPDGETGELIYQLDAKDIAERYSGYFNNEAATAKKVLRSVFKEGDAWYRTGDVVQRDGEGRLWFSDRIGDTFRWKSENVSTAEVAQVLGTHGSVLEANVYGVAVPGYEGRAGCAAVLLKNHALEEGGKVKKAVLEGIATFARNSLPRYAVPVFLRVVRELQVTGNNKQQKVHLRREGVDPALVTGNEQVYWLRPQNVAYERFGRTEWDDVVQKRAKL